jgi:hypothetical protein
MPLAKKVLWIVNMNSEAAETAFSKHALAIGATAVCIRTSSKRLPAAIKRFHGIGIKVFAWRWPSASKAGAENEANNVAKKLIPGGLDGYIVDPESDKAGAANDWHRAELAPLAHIPWKEFYTASDVLLPQTYWRWTNPTTGKKGQKINGGTPAKAFAKGVPAWKAKSLGKPIVPMAGEVDVVTEQEIAAYGAALQNMGVDEGHFYADNNKISVKNLAAMQAL